VEGGKGRNWGSEEVVGVGGGRVGDEARVAGGDEGGEDGG